MCTQEAWVLEISDTPELARLDLTAAGLRSMKQATQLWLQLLTLVVKAFHKSLSSISEVERQCLQVQGRDTRSKHVVWEYRRTLYP